MMLPEIGEEGQRKIRAAKVLLVGVGGLGSPIATYLTGAGIGRIGIIDDDVVDITNLHRQVLYTEEEAGLPKVECAKRRLRALNSEVEIDAYHMRLTKDNAKASHTSMVPYAAWRAKWLCCARATAPTARCCPTRKLRSVCRIPARLCSARRRLLWAAWRLAKCCSS